jgi:hypothetical protein
MNLSYTLNGRTADRKRIFGNVIIDSTANISAPNERLSFSIISFHICCEGMTFCGCGNDADSISFIAGPPGSDEVVTTNGLWSMGEWNNGGSGVWFRNADGSRYETAASGFGKLIHYKYIGPRIELCADMVTQGPFQPFDKVLLTWDPQFYLYDERIIGSP